MFEKKKTYFKNIRTTRKANLHYFFKLKEMNLNSKRKKRKKSIFATDRNKKNEFDFLTLKINKLKIKDETLTKKNQLKRLKSLFFYKNKLLKNKKNDIKEMLFEIKEILINHQN